MPYELLLIGQVQAQSGIAIPTLRYYEGLGLIKAVSRTPGGFRQFSPQVLPRLAFIKRLQSLGLSLAEIQALLAIHDRGQLPCTAVQESLKQKTQVLDQRLEELQELKRELDELLDQWPATTPADNGTICPVLQPVP